MARYLIGVDIGGSKIAVVLADARGRIVKSDEFQILRKPQSSIQELIRKIQALTQGRALTGIGIGTPGPVNPASGKIPWSPNLPGWQGTPIVRILKRKFRVPVFIENDANAAAICESKFGQGRGRRNLIYITVSTGIGGGLILNGVLYSGSHFSAGELGHMTVVPGGNPCRCGKRGCLEAHASGTAIGKEAGVNSRLVKEAAGKGDKRAKQILEKAGRYLGIAIGNLINLLNPEMIILGGGVMKGPEKGLAVLWRAMIQSAKRESWPIPFRGCRIVRTRFRDHVGALGAAALAVEKLEKLG